MFTVGKRSGDILSWLTASDGSIPQGSSWNVTNEESFTCLCMMAWNGEKSDIE